MTIEWYDTIAKRLGGYVQNWKHDVHGLSGEDVFERLLVEHITNESILLDAGCSHGDFTMKWSKLCQRIIGIDNSQEMIHAAQQLAATLELPNVEFHYASTKAGLPFNAESFDIIYSRRGPTSIIQFAHLLKPGGLMLGIHSTNRGKVEEQLSESQLQDIQIYEYLATMTFPTQEDFIRFLSRIPGNPDYTSADYAEEVIHLVNTYTHEGVITYPEYRYIWTGRR